MNITIYRHLYFLSSSAVFFFLVQNWHLVVVLFIPRVLLHCRQPNHKIGNIIPSYCESAVPAEQRSRRNSIENAVPIGILFFFFFFVVVVAITAVANFRRTFSFLPVNQFARSDRTPIERRRLYLWFLLRFLVVTFLKVRRRQFVVAVS